MYQKNHPKNYASTGPKNSNPINIMIASKKNYTGNTWQEGMADFVKRYKLAIELYLWRVVWIVYKLDK
jgi:hypothetical protein